MRFLFPLVLAALSSTSFAQPRDSDFDGLEDDKDPKPFVTDVPRIRIAMGNVNFGIHYSISGNTTTTLSKDITLESSVALTNTEVVKSTKSSEVLKRTSSSLAGGLSTGARNGISSLGVTLNASAENTNTFKYSSEITKESIKKYSEVSKEVAAWQSQQEIKFGPNSGYIHTSLKIFNLGLNSIKLENLEVKVVEYDLSTNSELSILKVVKLGDHNIDPIDDQFVSYGIPVRLDSISTHEILSTIGRNNIIKIEIQSYRIKYNNVEFVPSILNRQLRENTIKINVYDQFNHYNEYHVALAAESETGISLIKALQQIKNSEVVVSDTIIDGVRKQHLSLFNGARSEFYEWGDPTAYKESELSDKAWVVLPNTTETFSLPLTGPAPPNSEYSVIYMSKRSLWDQYRRVEDYSYFLGDTDLTKNMYYWQLNYVFPMNETQGKSNKSVVDRFEARNKQHRPLKVAAPELSVNSEDIITLEFFYKLAYLKEADTMQFFTPRCRGRNCSGDWSTFNAKHRRLLIDDYEIKNYSSLDDVNVSLTFDGVGRSIPIADVVRQCGGTYSVHPNGKVAISFKPNRTFAPKENQLFTIEIYPMEERHTFGLDIVRGSGFRVSKFEDRKIRLPFQVDLKVQLSRPPKAEKELNANELKALIDFIR